MTNKALAFWVIIGLTFVVAVVWLSVRAIKGEKESEKLKGEVSQLRQQNAMLVTENVNLKNGNRWGG